MRHCNQPPNALEWTPGVHLCLHLYALGPAPLIAGVRRQASAIDNYENHTQEKLEGWSSYVFSCRSLFWRSSDYLRQVVEAKYGGFILFVVLALCRIERHIFQEEQAGMTGLMSYDDVAA